MIRKRCKHAHTLTGRAKLKAWRQCGCVWGVDLYVDGRRTWHNLGTDEQAAAVAELRLRADLREGRRVRRRPGEGIDDVMDAWLTWKIAGGARVNSIDTYTHQVKHVKRYFGHLPAVEVTDQVVARFAADLTTAGLADSTVNGVLSTFGAALGYAREAGMAVPHVKIPMRSVRKEGDKPWRMTVSECWRVIHASPPEWASMMEVALLTGLRRGELLSVTAGDLVGDVLHVRRTQNKAGGFNDPKTRNGVRAVRLSPRALEVIRERCELAGDGRLWPYTLHGSTNALRRKLNDLGMWTPQRGWHCFRNAHTALLNEAGVSLRDAAARLGHGSNTAQSMRYGWSSEQADVGALDDAVSRHDVPSLSPQPG